MFQIATLPNEVLRSDMLVITLSRDFIQTRRKSFNQFPVYISELLKTFLEYRDFKGEYKESAVFYPPKGSAIKRLCLLGLGEEKEVDQDKFRAIGNLMVEFQERLSAKRVHLFLGNINYCKEEIIQAVSEGVLYKKYRFEKYKTSAKQKVTSGLFIFACMKKQYTPKFRKAQLAIKAIMEGVNLARDLANEPSNHLTPGILKNYVLDHFKEIKNIKTEVHDKHWLEKNGLNALLAVSGGSKEEPCLITLKYTPPKSTKKRLLLVGKGVTFDSGGISIKPAANMEEMKYDMAGAAAVIGSMEAISRLQPRFEVVAIIPAVENMPGGSAVKPGDVVAAFNDKTIEIINTDAEGRLILADALAYGVKKYKPGAVIDFATLTGACVVALGDKMAGLFTNSENLRAALTEAAELSGDRVWPMPLSNLYAKDLESDVADLKNLGGRWGGAITAAKFLENFTAKTKWAHVYMAGTAYDVKNIDYLGKGATGFGPRLVCQALKALEKIL